MPALMLPCSCVAAARIAPPSCQGFSSYSCRPPFKCLRASFAMLNDEGHQQSSLSNGNEMEPEPAAVWSSLSRFVHSDGGQSGTTDASENMLGLSSSLFSDMSSFDMEDEEAATYVPPPDIDARDLEMNKKAENVLYIFKDVLAGPMKKVGADKRCIAAWRLLNDEVRVHDPLVCFKGKRRLHTWLKTLADAGTVMDLHEIYSKSSISHPLKRWVHAVWTLSLTNDLQKSSMELGIWTWWMQNYDAFLRDVQCGDPISITQHKNKSNMNISFRDLIADLPEGVLLPSKSTPAIQLKLSGESKFELDRSGQVLCIESAWYITKEEGREMFETAKLWLAALLYKEANE